MAPKVYIVTTCMGRLHHLKQTVPRFLSDTRFRFILSDYSCPDMSGAWIERNYPNSIVVRSRAKIRSGKYVFKKVEALNAGAKRAIELGADYLCFLDADTLVHPGFHDWVIDHLDHDKFLVCKADYKKYPHTLQLSGFLCMHTSHFNMVGGFDQRMEGWGGDDMDMRVKLYAFRELEWKYIPLELVDPIHHDDSERVRYYVESDKRVTNHKNLIFIIETFRKRYGQDPLDLVDQECGRKFYELIGMDPEECASRK